MLTLTPAAMAADTATPHQVAAPQSPAPGILAEAPCGVSKQATPPPFATIRYYYRNCFTYNQKLTVIFQNRGELWCLGPGTHFIGANPIVQNIYTPYPEGENNRC
ncbi:hypothetical protein [Saccharothrix carnea]|nr:hypothetical protein [Saccharothrix carnea]